MIESALVLCCFITIIIVYWDIKRRALKHQSFVNGIKSKIATSTNMTANFAAFSHGPKITLLLASSGPYDLFLYYKIVNGKCIEQHQVSLQKILGVQLVLNNSPYKTTTTTDLPSISQRATYIARQELDAMASTDMLDVKRIILILTHNTKDVAETLSMPLYQAVEGKKTEQASKILLNALWWQQFLLAYIGKTDEIDTKPF